MLLNEVPSWETSQLDQEMAWDEAAYLKEHAANVLGLAFYYTVKIATLCLLTDYRCHFRAPYCSICPDWMGNGVVALLESSPQVAVFLPRRPLLSQTCQLMVLLFTFHFVRSL